MTFQSVRDLQRSLPMQRRGVRFVFALAVIVVCYILLRIVSPVSTHTVEQCLFKAYFPIDEYVRSGKDYISITEVLRDHNMGGFGSSSLPTDKGADHQYQRVYDKLLPPYRAKQGTDSDSTAPTTLLEIGVKKGGSLKLFREFFRESARIYGADIDPTITSFPRDIGIKTVVLNSTDQQQVRQTFGTVGSPTFDIIIDDGCHLLRCIAQTFANFWPSLRERGIYIIEDYPEYFDRFPHFHPHRYFAKEGRTACMIKDTSARGDVEYVVAVYPKNSRAPEVGDCQRSA